MIASRWLIITLLIASNITHLTTYATENSISTTVAPRIKKQKRSRHKNEQKSLLLSGKKTRLIKDMSYQELSTTLVDAQKKNNKEIELKCLERLYTLCTNQDELPNLLLSLADAYFATQSFAKAAVLYKEFVTSYPGSSQCQDAYAQLVIATYNTTLSHDRDQSATTATIEFAEEFLKLFPESTYDARIRSILNDCFEKKAAHELEVCAFYLKKGNVDAVKQRVDHLKIALLPKLPSLALDIAYFESKVSSTESLAPTVVAHNTKYRAAVDLF